MIQNRGASSDLASLQSPLLIAKEEGGVNIVTTSARGELSATSPTHGRSRCLHEIALPPLLRRGDNNMTAPPAISRVRYRIFLYRRSPGTL